MELALIGLPQSGKSTLLRALTRGRTEAASHGSSRMEINTGVTYMADSRLETLAGIFKPPKTVPVEMRFLDVPAPYAGDMRGIAGQFLNTVQGVDALVHVVRRFEDPSVPHAKGGVDPRRDMEEMEAELLFSDQAILERRQERIQASMKGAKGHERDLLVREEALAAKLAEALDQGTPVREQALEPDELPFVNNYQLLTAKPLLTALNVGEDETASGPSGDSHGLDDVPPDAPVVSVCARLEEELFMLEPEEEQQFRESLGVGESGLDRLAAKSHELLGLASFFTYGPKEVRAWSIPAGTPASAAAGRIHSDMERGFIRAEVVAYDDLAACGSIAQCKKQGVFRLEGKSYPVKDGDVIIFLFNV